MEKSYQFKQKDIIQHVDMNSKRKAFDLKLNQFGPYRLDYTRNGRSLGKQYFI